MPVVETIARIHRDHLVRGVPIEKIARDLRDSRNALRKVLRRDESSFIYEPKIQPMPMLGPWVHELERRASTRADRTMSESQQEDSAPRSSVYSADL